MGDKAVRGFGQAGGEEPSSPLQGIQVVLDSECRLTQGGVPGPEWIGFRGSCARSSDSHLQDLVIQLGQAGQGPELTVPPRDVCEESLEPADLLLHHIQLLREIRILQLQLAGPVARVAAHTDDSGKEDQCEGTSHGAPDRDTHPSAGDAKLADWRVLVRKDEERPLLTCHSQDSGSWIRTRLQTPCTQHGTDHTSTERSNKPQ